MGFFDDIKRTFSQDYNTVVHSVSSTASGVWANIQNASKKVENGAVAGGDSFKEFLGAAAAAGGKVVNYVADHGDKVIDRIGSFGDKTLSHLEGIEAGVDMGVQGLGTGLKGIGGGLGGITEMLPYLVLILGGLFIVNGGVGQVASAATARYSLPK